MKASEIIHLRIEAETLELIRQQARENYRTIAQQINYTLKQANASKEGQK
jgi:hypothetical protein